MLTLWWKKLTRLCLCESPSNLGNKYNFHLQEPKISSFSMCGILIVKYEPIAYFRIMFASWFGSLDWVAFHKRSSFLSSPWPYGPPFFEIIIQYCLLKSLNIIIISYKIQTNSLFPQLLKPYVMHYFKDIASGHVCKLFGSDFLQNIIYVY
jgi:hypothetical protein